MALGLGSLPTPRVVRKVVRRSRAPGRPVPRKRPADLTIITLAGPSPPGGRLRAGDPFQEGARGPRRGSGKGEAARCAGSALQLIARSPLPVRGTRLPSGSRRGGGDGAFRPLVTIQLWPPPDYCTRRTAGGTSVSAHAGTMPRPCSRRGSRRRSPSRSARTGWWAFFRWYVTQRWQSSWFLKRMSRRRRSVSASSCAARRWLGRCKPRLGPP